MAKKKMSVKKKPCETPPAKAPPARLLKHIAEQLRPLAESVDAVKPNPKNPNQHDAGSIAAIAASLKRYGQLRPIVVNRRNDEIEAGEGTHEAAKSLGWKYIAMVRVDHDPASQCGYTIADNRTAQLSKIDDALLLEMVAQVAAEEGTSGLLESLLLAELLESPETEEVAFEASAGQEAEVAECYQVVIACSDEKHQKKIYERLTGEGLACKLLTM